LGKPEVAVGARCDSVRMGGVGGDLLDGIFGDVAIGGDTPDVAVVFREPDVAVRTAGDCVNAEGGGPQELVDRRQQPPGFQRLDVRRKSPAMTYSVALVSVLPRAVLSVSTRSRAATSSHNATRFLTKRKGSTWYQGAQQ